MFDFPTEVVDKVDAALIHSTDSSSLQRATSLPELDGGGRAPVPRSGFGSSSRYNSRSNGGNSWPRWSGGGQGGRSSGGNNFRSNGAGNNKRFFGGGDNNEPVNKKVKFD